MTILESFFNFVEDGIADIGEFFSSHAPSDLGEDQKLRPTEPPLVPQVNSNVQQAVYVQQSSGSFTLTGLPIDQVYSSAEKTYPNKDGLMANIYGVPIKNPDGTYTDAAGHTIMASDVDGSPILPKDVPQYYEWYKRNDLVNKIDGNELSSQVRAEDLSPPTSPVHIDEPPILTYEEIKNDITLEFIDGMWVKAKHGIPLSEELERIDERDRVNAQRLYDSIGDTIKGLQLWSASQDKHMAKRMLELERVTPEDPLYEFKLEEAINMWKETNNSVVPGGMKIARGLNGVIKGTSTVVYEISKLGSTRNFRPGALEHILEGELTAGGRAVGFHYEGMPTAVGKVIPETVSKPNTFGVYKAQVDVGGVSKSGNAGASSFFPKEWTPQQVVNSINEAYANRSLIRGNTFRGVTESGMEIEMYLDKTGQIISAFPIY
ncbi:EndoU domain-containing protein [Sporomusa sp.]|uniref:EndoU domain-containing protein n=1 Tax=Sporomusa sp. TaxID=2078658 RepID=UPI002C96211D|nr:EndoU domain-containing protein [Sporomusa sp.]HWR06732.1 EndoU domain-containing protein [Sporomusa sp.]